MDVLHRAAVAVFQQGHQPASGKIDTAEHASVGVLWQIADDFDVNLARVGLVVRGYAQGVSFISRVIAKLPQTEVAQQPNQPAAMLILFVEMVYVDSDGCPIEYGISRFNSTAVQLTIEP